MEPLLFFPSERILFPFCESKAREKRSPENCLKRLCFKKYSKSLPNTLVILLGSFAISFAKYWNYLIQ